MRVLITGAGGHLGREVAKALAGHELTLLTHSPANDLPHGKEYVVDFASGADLETIFATQRPEVVIHLAAMVGNACQSNPQAAHTINVAATARLGELAARYKARDFLFTSSAAVYHQQSLEPTDEDHNVNPQSVYGQTKLQAEQALSRLANNVTRFTVLRIFNIYGPVFTDSLVYKLANGRPVALNGLDTFYRDYVHVNDVVSALTTFRCLDNLHDFTVLNIASGRATSNTALVDRLRQLGCTPNYTVQPAVPSYSWADISRAEQLLNFEPQTSIML